MWIMDCERKMLIDAKYFSINKIIGGGKAKKWAIHAYSQTSAAITLTGVICACFSDEDRAVAELEKVAAFAEENPGKVYKFSK